jgi:glycosyltransferase involved in cell wall biosynthesis
VETFVFSYQRGPYLANFLRSVEACGWSDPVTIVDDGSSDPATLRVLQSAESDGHRVIRRQHRSSGAWGGLQASMALALELAQGPVTLFAQDDLQLVRPLVPGESGRIAELVSADGRSPFLFPSFHMQSWKASRNARNFAFDAELGMPTRTLHHPLPGYSEVSVFSPQRLRAAGWDTSFEEKGGSVLAYHLFGPMLSYPYPFLAFVPYPSVPRRGVRYRLRHPRRRPSPAELEVMDPERVEELFGRDPSVIPFATDWLRVRSPLRRRLLGSVHWEH